MPDLHLISNHQALLVAHRLDPGNREAATAQLWQRLLQRCMEITLQSKFRRRQDARVHSISLPVSVVRDELHLAGCGWPAGFRKVAEPMPWRGQHEHENQDHRDVVLPRAALVRPEKRLRENPAEACHVSPRGRRPQ